VPIAARQGTLPVARSTQDEDDDPAEDLSKFALRNAPPWLVSAVVHMVLRSSGRVAIAFVKTYVDLVGLFDRLGEQPTTNR
jgi:hypothetical protein